eukprot:gene18221-21742_t
MSSRPLIAPWRLRLRFGFRNGRLTAAWGLLILLTWLALAVFAPWIAPFDPIAQNTDISLLGPSQILVLKESDFALAAKSLGFGHGRILFRHLLPNAMFGSI